MLAHHGSSNLAQAYTMAPSLTVQDKLVALFHHIEGRAVEVGFAEGATNLEFLTDGEGLLGTYDLQLPDAAALSPDQSR